MSEGGGRRIGYYCTVLKRVGLNVWQSWVGKPRGRMSPRGRKLSCTRGVVLRASSASLHEEIDAKHEPTWPHTAFARDARPPRCSRRSQRSQQYPAVVSHWCTSSSSSSCCTTATAYWCTSPSSTSCCTSACRGAAPFFAVSASARALRVGSAGRLQREQHRCAQAAVGRGRHRQARKPAGNHRGRR